MYIEDVARDSLRTRADFNIACHLLGWSRASLPPYKLRTVVRLLVTLGLLFPSDLTLG
jgi:hypothetical protein